MTIDGLLAKWLDREGGAERANYQMFLSELTGALGLPAPEPKGAGLGAYEFEAPVKSEAALGRKGTGRIDLYKRDCFILEAKQSQLKPGEAAPPEPAAPPPEPIRDLFGNVVGYDAPAKAAPRYDRLMADARLQAERYALALPGDHRAPPFLIVADIGRSFELYFDWSGNGRGYAPFPNERSYRIALADLNSPALLPDVRLTSADVLRAVWTDPAAIDPRLRTAEVTRDIAERLSKVAAQLEREERQRNPGAVEIAMGIEATSLFLMRMLFCMFAEDVGRDGPPEQQLLPKGSFQRFLREAADKSSLFWRNGLADLWFKMNARDEVNRFWLAGDAVVRYFNGNLFSNTRIFDLPAESKRELLVAAGKDWRQVEPAIFGTLLEQVLTPQDRARLGAHYTPRAYVERLVEAVIMEVLRPEWEAVREEAMGILNPPRDGEVAARSADGGGSAPGDAPGRPPPPPRPAGAVPLPANGEDYTGAAIALVTAFHARLAEVRVLDPACGTGNFLYVAMEQLLRLEGEVRQFAAGLGAEVAPAVHPNQFLGLELNPRAAVIAELVLWIGWLRYRLANTPDAIGTPVLPPLSNINGGTHGGYDAVLVRTATGEPDTANPRRPDWPAADFIVGNPPFIGGKDLRERLGSDYAESLWRANPRVPKSADFVMHWWDRAAELLTRDGTRLRRFGFVTTNSITQVFSRRVIEGWLAPSPSPLRGEGGRAEGEVGRGADVSDAPPTSAPLPDPLPGGERELVGKLHLTLAIPDHPWTRVTRDAAAVRIAMTVAAAGAGTGKLVRITGERAIDTDAPELDEDPHFGPINADLTVGTDVTRVVPLRANEGLCSRGVQLMGAGFIVTPAEAKALGLGTRAGLEAHIRDYRNGRDLLQRPRGVMVIDLFGLTEAEVMTRFPEVYQHLLKTVKPERDANRRDSYRKNWWIFGEPRRELRAGLAGLDAYVITVETAKHRAFFRMSAEVLPDNRNVCFALDDVNRFGVLSSIQHALWTAEMEGTLEDRPIYTKTACFDPFPFPDAIPEQAAAIGEIAERLDATRRAALAEDDKLTVTGLYNLVAAVRDPSTGSGRTGLAPADEAKAVRARARIVAKLHDDLDAAVAAAYGWEWPLPPAEIVARLVALNAERAAEEKAGQVRWLRPDYQIPRFGTG